MFVNPKKAYTYFAKNFALKKTSQNWYAFDNPFDSGGEGKKKMAVKFSWQRVKCWRTGYSATISDFIADYEGLQIRGVIDLVESCKESSLDLMDLDSVRVKKSVEGVKMPYGYMNILEGDTVLAKRARKYLRGRGFDLNMLDLMGFGYCYRHGEEADEDYFGYIIIPFKTLGSLQYFIGRDFIGNFLRYKNPNKNKFGVGKADILFNEDALLIYNRNFVVEGWSDAVTLGPEAVATLGWSVSDIQRTKLIESNCDELVFIPDVGKYKEAVKLAMKFIDLKESVIVVNLDELSEYGDDVNSIAVNMDSKKPIMDLYRNTGRLTTSLAMEILMS